MEIKHYSFVIALFASVATLYVAFKLLNFLWFKPKKIEKQLQKQGLKGNPYRFLHGDLKEMKEMIMEARSKPVNGFSHAFEPRVIPLFQDVIHKYGKNTYVWFGPKASVVIMDPESIKDVTSKYAIYGKTRANPLAGQLIRGLVTYEGDKWAKHRKIVNPAFHQDKLKHMLPAFDTSAMETINKWEEMVSTKGSNEVDVWPHLQSMTCDAISRAAFGRHYEEGNRIFELHIEQSQLILTTMQSPYIPGWRFLPTKMNRRIKSVSNSMNNSVRKIVNERMKAMRKGEASEDDLLGILLQSNFKEIDKHGNKEFCMSIQEVIEECKVFYFAGQETVSTLLVWTLIMLSKYSHWQTLAREEVLQLFGTKRPDFDGLNHMKIVTMIFYEVLRLYPPLSVMTRRTTKEITLGKVTLPADILLSLPTMLMHRDTEIWGEDALEFMPERFAQGISHVTKGRLTYFPFGWGPRICIGQNFGMLEAKMAMALFLQRFSFELSPSYTHAPVSIITLQPQHGAHLILHKI